jgi:hypothetical protein
MDWVRLDCLMLAFEDPAQAREAALCLREDQQTMTALAGSAHRDTVQTTLYIEEIEEQLRPVFLSAVVGETIGPVQIDGEHLLYQVAAKTMPAVGNPDLQQRATDRLTTKALAGESRRRVRWLLSW